MEIKKIEGGKVRDEKKGKGMHERERKCRITNRRLRGK